MSKDFDLPVDHSPREYWTWNARFYASKDAAYAAFEAQPDGPYRIISPPYLVREVMGAK